jgi:hypothetical protein
MRLFTAFTSAGNEPHVESQLDRDPHLSEGFQIRFPVLYIFTMAVDFGYYETSERETTFGG